MLQPCSEISKQVSVHKTLIDKSPKPSEDLDIKKAGLQKEIPNPVLK